MSNGRKLLAACKPAAYSTYKKTRQAFLPVGLVTRPVWAGSLGPAIVPPVKL